LVIFINLARFISQEDISQPQATPTTEELAVLKSAAQESDKPLQDRDQNLIDQASQIIRKYEYFLPILYQNAQTLVTLIRLLLNR
jgi:hypothetical protein